MSTAATTTPGARTSRTATSSSRLPSWAAISWRRTKYELVTFFREMDALVFSFAYPIIMMAIFASVFSFDVAPGVPFSQYFLPGMVATGIMLSSFQTVALSIATDRDDSTLKHLRTTPMPLSSYFAGKVGQVLLTSLIQIGLLLLVSRFAFDVPLPTGVDLWVRFAWIFVLGTATGVILGIAYASVPRSAKSASSVVIPVVLVLQFISGVFFVFSDLPAWMQNFASVFPLKWMAQGMRSVFLPDSFAATEPAGNWQLGLTALILAAWLIVGLIWGMRTFRWTRRSET